MPWTCSLSRGSKLIDVKPSNRLLFYSTLGSCINLDRRLVATSALFSMLCLALVAAKGIVTPATHTKYFHKALWAAVYPRFSVGSCLEWHFLSG